MFMKQELPEQLKGKEELLKKIKTVIAPLSGNKVFIGGGCPLALYTNKTYGDIDVYFTCPMKQNRWDVLTKLYAKSGITLSKPSGADLYDGTDGWEVAAKLEYQGENFQFIWVKAKLLLNFNQFMDHAMGKFDIDLCKIAIYFKDDVPVLYRTNYHELDLSSKKLTLNIGYTPIQTQRTLEVRLPKYVCKFPDFKLDINEVSPSRYAGRSNDLQKKIDALDAVLYSTPPRRSRSMFVDNPFSRMTSSPMDPTDRNYAAMLEERERQSQAAQIHREMQELQERMAAQQMQMAVPGTWVQPESMPDNSRTINASGAVLTQEVFESAVRRVRG